MNVTSNLVGRKRSSRHDLCLDLNKRVARIHGCQWVIVSSAVAKDEIAYCIRHPGVDKRVVSPDRFFEHVGAPVELAMLFPLGQQRTDAGRRVKPRNAGAAGAHALGQRALRQELNFELPLAHHLLGL